MAGIYTPEQLQTRDIEAHLDSLGMHIEHIPDLATLGAGELRDLAEMSATEQFYYLLDTHGIYVAALDPENRYPSWNGAYH